MSALCQSVFGPVGPSLMRAVSSSRPPSHAFLPPNRKRDAGRVPGGRRRPGDSRVLSAAACVWEVWRSLFLSDPSNPQSRCFPERWIEGGGSGGGRTGGMNYKNITAEPDLAGKLNGVGSRRLEINIALDQADAHMHARTHSHMHTHTGLQN